MKLCHHQPPAIIKQHSLFPGLSWNITKKAEHYYVCLCAIDQIIIRCGLVKYRNDKKIIWSVTGLE